MSLIAAYAKIYNQAWPSGCSMRPCIQEKTFESAPQSEEFKLQVADLFNEFDEDSSGALDKPELKVSSCLCSPSFGASERSGPWKFARAIVPEYAFYVFGITRQHL